MHLAHKAEHAVEVDTGAGVAVTIAAADEGDPATKTKPCGRSVPRDSGPP